jgi:hypothetical protein
MHDEAPSDLTELPAVTDPAVRRMLGVFDLPAFARRGQELEQRIERLRFRCRHQRATLLAPVQMRLRQWAEVATGPGDWADAFTQSPLPLWDSCEAQAALWARAAAKPGRRRSVARDLVASVSRFNRRWGRFLDTLDLRPLNLLIEGYNTYYLIEKECSMGSARLAARHFQPYAPWSTDDLWRHYPLIAIPPLRERS